LKDILAYSLFQNKTVLTATT